MSLFVIEKIEALEYNAKVPSVHYVSFHKQRLMQKTGKDFTLKEGIYAQRVGGGNQQLVIIMQLLQMSVKTTHLDQQEFHSALRFLLKQKHFQLHDPDGKAIENSSFLEPV